MALCFMRSQMSLGVVISASVNGIPTLKPDSLAMPTGRGQRSLLERLTHLKFSQSAVGRAQP